MESGERGTFETSINRRGVTQGFFVPKDPPSSGAKAKIVELDPEKGELRIFPINTIPGHKGLLEPKYKKIRKIALPVEIDEYTELVDLLEDLPPGLTKDPEYGLGFARECDPVIDFIELHTDCASIELTASGDAMVSGRTFRLSQPHLAALRATMDHIKTRGNGGIRRVKEKHVHDSLGPVIGLDVKELSMGRLPDSKWMTKVAAGEVPLNADEEDELLAAVSSSANAIAGGSPQKLVRLQADIQVANLDQLVDTLDLALGEAHPEAWWQTFFEENVFVLQLIFGGPTVFIDSQVPIGDADTSLKGKKIADYLFKHALTNNAALVEIKKPSTQLLSKTPYRKGVYGVHSEIGKSVTQVLDQALHLSHTEAATKKRTGDGSWSITAPRCFVVVGRASELDTDDKRKSFELYREHLSGVRIVTYDEILEQLKSLRDFLAAEIPK
jgi:hypothetical protein